MDEQQEAGHSMTSRFSRKRLLQVGAAGAATATAGGLLSDSANAAEAAATPPLRFLTKWEFDYVTAMAETIWPTDDLGPGARVAGVGYYIDGQLSGGWGKAIVSISTGRSSRLPTAATAGRSRWRRATCIAHSCLHTTNTCVRRLRHSYIPSSTPRPRRRR